RKLARSSSEENAWSIWSLFHMLVSKLRVRALANARETKLTQNFLARRDLTVAFDCVFMFSGLRSAKLSWSLSG
ncbi:14101_t:CDS:2, partial [Dentiscutata heterogama]